MTKDNSSNAAIDARFDFLVDEIQNSSHVEEFREALEKELPLFLEHHEDIDLILSVLLPDAIRRNFHVLLAGGAAIDKVCEKVDLALLALDQARNEVCPEDEVKYSFQFYGRNETGTEIATGLKNLIDLGLSEEMIANYISNRFDPDTCFEIIISIIEKDPNLRQKLRPESCWQGYFEEKLGNCCNLSEFFEIVDFLHDSGGIEIKEIIDFVVNDDETFQEFFDKDLERLEYIFEDRRW